MVLLCTARVTYGVTTEYNCTINKKNFIIPGKFEINVCVFF